MHRILVASAVLALTTACGRENAMGDTASSMEAVAAPTADTIPAGPYGDAIRRGRAILIATRDSLPAHVGNELRCVSCHLDEGRRPYAMPWTGVYARFPQYRSRSATVQTLEDRINDCFERSLAGTSVPLDSPEMRAMVAYMAWLSRGVPTGSRTPGQGLDSVDVREGDAGRGEQVYAASCARCHGANGEGMPGFPPVWGPGSFTVGAGMGRALAAASFIHRNMPYDKPGSLTEQQALDVALYLGTKPRPDFADKARDWPKGGAPKDSPYRELLGGKRS
jgi:thiosulfate dehydrogenase